MRLIILVTLVVLVFGLLPPASHACYCVLPNVPTAFERAEAVFVGEVAEITPPRSYDDKAPYADRFYTVRFKVENTMKGTPSLEIEIFTNQGGMDCLVWKGGPFIKGDRYLVYAEPVADANETGLAVLSCGNRTASLERARAEVGQVKDLSPGFNYSFRPFPGVWSRKETLLDSWLRKGIAGN